jgi:hypothetical protein
MSDWQVGDLAVCVDASPCRCERCEVLGRVAIVGLREGASYAVLEVCLDDGYEYIRFAVQTRRNNHWLGWAGSDRFRKIRPDKHEECESEFVTLLKRRKVSA